MDAITQAQLKAEFERFRADPVCRFHVRTRRKRAEQIRELAADPEKVDTATFNREIWVGTSSITLDGQPAPDILERYAHSSLEEQAELEQALATGRLTVHGD